MLERLDWTELLLRWSGEAIAPVAEQDWVAAADPGFYEMVCADHGYEWPPDDDDGPPLMNRSLLLSSGAGHFLYDTGRPGADGEWATNPRAPRALLVTARERSNK